MREFWMRRDEFPGGHGAHDHDLTQPIAAHIRGNRRYRFPFLRRAAGPCCGMAGPLDFSPLDLRDGPAGGNANLTSLCLHSINRDWAGTVPIGRMAHAPPRRKRIQKRCERANSSVLPSREVVGVPRSGIRWTLAGYGGNLNFW